MKRVSRALVALGLVAPFAGGCQFYSVTDKETGKSGYMTLNWVSKRHGEEGTRFIDLKTGRNTTLASTEVTPIPYDEAWAELAAAKAPPR
jgi:hypothetical protein